MGSSRCTTEFSLDVLVIKATTHDCYLCHSVGMLSCANQDWSLDVAVPMTPTPAPTHSPAPTGTPTLAPTLASATSDRCDFTISATPQTYGKPQIFEWSGACSATFSAVTLDYMAVTRCQADPQFSILWLKASVEKWPLGRLSCSNQWWLINASKQVARDSCEEATDLSLVSSPYTGDTTSGAKSHIISCGWAATPSNIFHIDIPVGHTLDIGITDDEFESQYEMRWGGQCPGSDVIVCQDYQTYRRTYDWDSSKFVETVVRTRTMWTNDQGTSQHVYFIVTGSVSGNFTLTWSMKVLTSAPTPRPTRYPTYFWQR